MTTLVAFLRGMNLGGRRITNDDLRAAFVAIGFDDATPYQASGNVIIEAVGRDERELRDVIASGLAGQLGYAVPTFLRSADEIAHIADREPFTAQELAATEGRVQVGLLHAAPSNAARDDMLALATADDRLAIDGRDLYWLPRAGISTSDLDLTVIGDDMGGITVRTQRTIQRLRARVSAS